MDARPVGLTISRTFFPLPSRQRDVNMAGEVSSLGARRWRWQRQRRRQLPRPAWYSTPSAKIKEQTPRHTIVETFLTLALARARDRRMVGGIKREKRARGWRRMLRNGGTRRAEDREGEERRRGGERKRGKEERWGGEREKESEWSREGETGRERGREEVRKTRAFGFGGSRREQATVLGQGRGQGKREGRRELDVRTNAICMILHVLARPGAAPIGFQLSAYVFCLLFWLYGMAGTRVVGLEGWRRQGGGRVEDDAEE